MKLSQICKIHRQTFIWFDGHTYSPKGAARRTALPAGAAGSARIIWFETRERDSKARSEVPGLRAAARLSCTSTVNRGPYACQPRQCPRLGTDCQRARCARLCSYSKSTQRAGMCGACRLLPGRRLAPQPHCHGPAWFRARRIQVFPLSAAGSDCRLAPVALHPAGAAISQAANSC